MYKAISSASLCVLLATGCAQLDGLTNKQPTNDGAAAAPGVAASAAASGGAPTSGKVPAGMNANGEVVDSKAVESGSGRKVTGRESWEGEITGKCTGKFAKLEIGTSLHEVRDTLGAPSDEGAYLTGKAWIPFYFGSDRHRYELVYEKQGRLIFAGGSLGDISGAHLIWVICNAKEAKYR